MPHDHKGIEGLACLAQLVGLPAPPAPPFCEQGEGGDSDPGRGFQDPYYRFLTAFFTCLSELELYEIRNLEVTSRGKAETAKGSTSSGAKHGYCYDGDDLPQKVVL